MTSDLRSLDWDEELPRSQLTPNEKIKLHGLLRGIQDDFTAIRERGASAGQKLLTIHAEKLYREHGSFAAFVQAELGRSRFTGYNLILLAQVTSNLAQVLNKFNTRLTQSEAKVLAQIPAEMQETAYRLA